MVQSVMQSILDNFLLNEFSLYLISFLNEFSLFLINFLRACHSKILCAVTIPFHRWGNWGSNRLSNKIKVPKEELGQHSQWGRVTPEALLLITLLYAYFLLVCSIKTPLSTCHVPNSVPNVRDRAATRQTRPALSWSLHSRVESRKEYREKG